MKICAITMVYRDYWALSQWYAHYSRHLGSEHLYIVAHGSDPKISELCPRASVITVPRNNLNGFDRERGQMLNSFQDALGVCYDWVIRTDADELICIDPAHYASFEDLLTSCSAPAVFALGLNVAEIDGDTEVKPGDVALANRDHAVFSGHYSKAWAVRRGVHMNRHGVRVRPPRLHKFPFHLPQDVYLAHLKYAHLDALIDANRHRIDIASGEERGLPGPAWRDADKDAKKFFKSLSKLPEIGWDEAKDTAYRSVLEEPVRDDALNTVRSKSISFKFRTTLPEWFKES